MNPSDIGYIIVGVLTVAAGAFGVWVTRRTSVDTAKGAERDGVMHAYQALTDDLAGQISELRAQVDDLSARAAAASKALSRAELVIELLVRQIRALGAEPDLPAHLTDAIPKRHDFPHDEGA